MTLVKPYEALGAFCVSILFNVNVEAAFRHVYGDTQIRNTVTDADKEDMFKLYGQGETMKDIAKMYGVSISYVSKIVKSFGGGRAKRIITGETINRILQLHADGVKQKDIIRITGVNQGSVSRLTKELKQSC